MATDPVAAEQMQILNKMPLILAQTLLFPYTSGLQMVTRCAGDRRLARRSTPCTPEPPASTEQVLHPDKYAAGEAPVEVAFPKDLAKRLGSGWSVDLQDTLGEFQLETWLEAAGVRQGDGDDGGRGLGRRPGRPRHERRSGRRGHRHPLGHARRRDRVRDRRPARRSTRSAATTR